MARKSTGIKLSKVVRKVSPPETEEAEQQKAPEPRVKKEKKQKTPRKSVLFVCTGNTCRSPMAELLFRDYVRRKHELSKFDIRSAGLQAEEGDAMTDNAVAALRELGVQVKLPHPAHVLTREMIERADLVVCMTASHAAPLASFGRKVTTVAALTGGRDVPDPYGGDLSVYAATAAYLQYAVREVYAALTHA